MSIPILVLMIPDHNTHVSTHFWAHIIIHYNMGLFFITVFYLGGGREDANKRRQTNGQS